MQVESVPGGQHHGLHFAEVEDAQKVSVMSLGGEVLVVLVVSGSSSVWELKGLLEMHILGRSVKAMWMTLLLGHQALANATSLREAGVVDGSMLSLIVSPRYNLLVCKNSPTIELRSEEGILERTLLIPTWGIRSVVFSPDNALVIIVECYLAPLWRLDRQEYLFTFWDGGLMRSAAFSPTGATVLTISTGYAKLWNVSSGHCVSILELHDSGNITPAFTTYGAMLLYTGEDCIALWDMELGTCLWKYRHCCHIGSACFSECGDWFFTITGFCNNHASAVDVWHVRRCSHDRQLEEHGADISYGPFSSDAWHVITVSSCNTARVWSLGHDWSSWAFHHDCTIDSAAFAPDGVQVVTVSGGYAWLWLVDGQTLGQRMPQESVWWACFSPESKYVLLRHSDGIAMWTAGDNEPRWSDVDKDISVVAFSHFS